MDGTHIQCRKEAQKPDVNDLLAALAAMVNANNHKTLVVDPISQDVCGVEDMQDHLPILRLPRDRSAPPRISAESARGLYEFLCDDTRQRWVITLKEAGEAI